MAIETTELSRTGLPDGYTTSHSSEFGGSLVIREVGELLEIDDAGIEIRKVGDLIAVDIAGDEKSAFIAAFPGRKGTIIYDIWKHNQESEGGELT